jgi:hypothetical protein
LPGGEVGVRAGGAAGVACRFVVQPGHLAGAGILKPEEVTQAGKRASGEILVAHTMTGPWMSLLEGEQRRRARVCWSRTWLLALAWAFMLRVGIR